MAFRLFGFGQTKQTFEYGECQKITSVVLFELRLLLLLCLWRVRSRLRRCGVGVRDPGLMPTGFAAVDQLWGQTYATEIFCWAGTALAGRKTVIHRPNIGLFSARTRRGMSK